MPVVSVFHLYHGSDPDATPPLGQATEVSQPALLLEYLGGNKRRLID